MATADFYFAINATFRHIHDTYGEQALIEYWEAMGGEFYRPVSERFREGGLHAVETYWKEFFAAEPGGSVGVQRREASVEIRVDDCPAIHHLRANGREVMPLYCRHCHHVSRVIAENAGIEFHLEGGGGACRQVFSLSNGDVP